MLTRDPAGPLYSGTLTASATGDTLDLQAGRASAAPVAFELVVSAISGTTPSLSVVVQTSTDGSAWEEAASLTLGAVGTQFAPVDPLATTTVRDVLRYVRCNNTVSGGTPSVTFSVYALVQRGE